MQDLKRNSEPIYTMTFDEVCEKAAAGETLITNLGYIICSRDRKFNKNTAQQLWHDDVNAATSKGLLKMKILKPVNVNDKPFSWSFSAINDWITCPLKYAGSRFYCDVPFEETEARRWGNFVHKALEDRINIGKPLPDELAALEKYPAAMLASGGVVTAEKSFAITREWKLTDWFAPNAWGRCKIDVTVCKDGKVVIYDWKTGKVPRQEKELQLDISALFTSLIMPEVEIFIPKFIYTAHEVISPQNKVIQKSDLSNTKQRVMIYLSQMEEAWETEVFPCKPSGLCRKYCGVHSCEHNGQFGR